MHNIHHAQCEADNFFTLCYFSSVFMPTPLFHLLPLTTIWSNYYTDNSTNVYARVPFGFWMFLNSTNRNDDCAVRWHIGKDHSNSNRLYRPISILFSVLFMPSSYRYLFFFFMTVINSDCGILHIRLVPIGFSEFGILRNLYKQFAYTHIV